MSKNKELTAEFIEYVLKSQTIGDFGSYVFLSREDAEKRILNVTYMSNYVLSVDCDFNWDYLPKLMQYFGEFVRLHTSHAIDIQIKFR